MLSSDRRRAESGIESEIDMRAELLPIDWSEEIRAFQAERSRTRTPGVHLSDITKRIIEKVEPGRYGDGPIDPALAQQGFIWEDVLSQVFARQFGQACQIETECDGIIMTLDGMRIGTSGAPHRVQEFKATKMSAGNAITSQKFFPWMIRTQGYCHAMGTNEAEIVVLFINGSYESGGGRYGAPTPKGWRIIFSKQEIRESWEWIQRERDKMLSENKSKKRGSR